MKFVKEIENIMFFWKRKKSINTNVESKKINEKLDTIVNNYKEALKDAEDERRDERAEFVSLVDLLIEKEIITYDEFNNKKSELIHKLDQIIAKIKNEPETKE